MKLFAGLGVLGTLTCWVLAFAICGFAFDYGLKTYVDKDIPWYGDCLAGVVTSPITVPVAVVGYVLVECDVPTPIFDTSGTGG